MNDRDQNKGFTGRSELDQMIDTLLADYLSRNTAARTLKTLLDRAGIGLLPVLDHLTFRTLDVDRRAEPFVRLGYTYDQTLEYRDWFAKIYRAPGYPALFIDQAFPGERGSGCLIPDWVAAFGDRTLHHVAVRVEEIERAIEVLREEGVQFSGPIVGEKSGVLRQIFTAPELVNGKPFSVLELTERHAGFLGFSPPQADGLMKSTLLAR
jgi:catechol 2,3-dioxygenase-like lactoylglutathione lyase family enzyme